MRGIWRFCLLGGLLMFEVGGGEEKGPYMLYMGLNTGFAGCLFMFL